ncbi:MAG TPA: iron ABC transporter permease [Rhizobiaceae bacterium]|nr:iron ABC transporter permease [Rhizobiaceae bacterium]
MSAHQIAAPFSLETKGLAGAARLQRAARWGGRLLLMAIVLFLFVYPVLMVVVSMFSTTRPGVVGDWTIENVRTVLTASATYTAVLNSMIFATVTTVAGTILAMGFAFIATRTTVPLRRLLTPAMLLLFAAPNMLYAVSWALLADPVGGALNHGLLYLGAGMGAFNVYSWPGLLLVHTLKISSFCYLLLLPAFHNMNRSFEEASLVAGATRLQTFLRIDIPLLLPAIIGVVMVGTVFGLGAFDVPQILGGLAGVPVLSTEIYKKLNYSFPPDYPGASALCLFLVVGLAAMVAVQWRLLRKNNFVTVTGKSFKNDRWNIGRFWNVVGAIVILLFVLVALVLPGAQLVLTSFQPSVGVYTLTLSNFRMVFADPQAPNAFFVTAVIAILGGFAAMALATLIGFVSRGAPMWMARLLESATLIPIVMPGVVLAVGLLWAYVSVPGLRQLYGSFWFAFIGLVILIMPIASRAVQGALLQISGDLEDAAAISGASSTRVLLDIVLRLMQGSFLAGWLVTAIIASGTLDIPLMLLPPTSPNVAVLAYGYMNSALMSQTSAVLVLLLAGIAGSGILAAIAIGTGNYFRARAART